MIVLKYCSSGDVYANEACIMVERVIERDGDMVEGAVVVK